MPVFEQGYRRFDGELSRKNRVIPMVMENVRTRVRWWTWLLLLFSSVWPWVIFGAVTFFFTMLPKMTGSAPIVPAGIAMPTMAYETGTNLDGKVLISMLQGGSPYLFWDALQWSTLWALVMPAICCAGILASDRRTGALQIYFARPVTRQDYLFSKFLTVAMFTLMVTAVPAMLLWFEACLFSPNSKFVIDTWFVPLAIIGSGCVYATWNASIVLALSSYMKRPVLVAIMGLVAWLTLAAVGGIMAETTDNRTWSILVPQVLMGGLTAPMFGLDLPEWLQSPWLLIYGGGLPAALLGLVWYRTKAIEVHT